MRHSLSDIRRIPIISIANALGIIVNKNKSMCFSGHDKSTPSLSFTPSKNLWHCFGCGKGGTSINLVMEVRGVDFKDAIKWIDNLFSVNNNKTYKEEVNKRDVSKFVHNEQGALNVQPVTLVDTEVYNWLFNLCSLSEIGRNYLISRGFTDDTINIFGFKDIIYPNKLFVQGINKWGKSRLLTSGLAKRLNINSNLKFTWWDHTILIPFKDNDSIIYIQGRRLSDKPPKYVNLSGIVKPLFNVSILKKIPRGETVYLCEGAFDAITACQYGLNGIGVLGASSFKPEWVDRFLQYQVIVIPDSDQAGSQFATTIRNMFIEKGKIINIARVPFGKDLSEYYNLRKLKKQGK